MGKITYGLSLIIMVTCSIPFLMGTLNGSVAAVDLVDDSNDVVGYRITGIIVPPNATMNTCCQSPTPLFNRTTGDFLLEGLKDGEYILAFGATGYEAFVQTIPINGSDVDLGIIFLESEGGFEQPSYQVEVGPWTGVEGNGIRGINVSFYIGVNRYWGLTDEEGMASIEIPIRSIPDGTEMSCTLLSSKDIPDGARSTTQHLSGVAASSAGVPADMSNWTSGDLSSEFNWKWNQDTPPYNVFGKKYNQPEKSRVLVYSISVILIIIFFFLVWSVMQVIRKRKS